MKIKTINGVTFKRFKELNQTRVICYTIIAGKIRASFDTLAECREAAKCVRYSG